jgi:hypothetical protein
MIVMVVISGYNICNYQYSFAFNLAVYGTLFYGTIFLLQHKFRNPFLALIDYKKYEISKKINKYAIYNSIAWSITNVFLLIANPKTPDIYQVVFNELTIVLVVMLSVYLNGHTYTIVEYFSIFILLIGGLLPIINASIQHSNDKYWYIIYLIGAWTIGIANTITENVMKNLYIQRCNYVDIEESSTNDMAINQPVNESTGCFRMNTVYQKNVPHDVQEENQKQYLVSVSQFLFLTNFYSIFLVAGLCIVPYLSQGDKTYHYWKNGMICLWTGICDPDDNTLCTSDIGLPFSQNYEDGIKYTWMSSTFSFIGAYIAGVLQRKKDAVYVTVVYTMAPVLSVIIFSLHLLMGKYYIIPNNIKIMSSIITFIGASGYKIYNVLKEYRTNVKEYGLKSVSWFKIKPYLQLHNDESTDSQFVNNMTVINMY